MAMINTDYEVCQDGFLVSTDPDLLQLDAIQDFLSRAYWAQGRPRHIIQRSIQNSLCFGVYQDAAQVGFARLVTDYTTYAWLCDVFIHEDFRGRGLAKLLIHCVTEHPELQNLRRWALATRDAHGLYEQFGFSQISDPQKYMQIFDPLPYAPSSE